jgi:integrase
MRRGDGIYRRGKTWWLDFVHQGRRHVVRIGANVNRTVAKEIASVERARVLRGEAGIGLKKKDISFGEAAELFLSWAQTNKKPGTALFYRDRLATLAKTFGGKKLSQITVNDVEQYKQGRVNGERGRVALNRDFSTLRALYNRMVDFGKYEGPNPVSKVARFRESAGRVRFLEWEEEARLLEQASEPLRTIILTGTDAGLRIEAETLTLRWSGIDFRRGTLSVVGAYSKNGKLRVVPLTDRLKEALLRHRFRSGKRELEEHVFLNRHGRPFGDIRTPFHTARAAAGLSDDVTPHTCRHTFGSRLAMAGKDIRTIQELMGHRDITMTVRYTHASDEHKAAAVRTALVPPESFHNAIHNTAPEADTAAG